MKHGAGGLLWRQLSGTVGEIRRQCLGAACGKSAWSSAASSPLQALSALLPSLSPDLLHPFPQRLLPGALFLSSLPLRPHCLQLLLSDQPSEPLRADQLASLLSPALVLIFQHECARTLAYIAQGIAHWVCSWVCRRKVLLLNKQRRWRP